MICSHVDFAPFLNRLDLIWNFIWNFSEECIPFHTKNLTCEPSIMPRKENVQLIFALAESVCCFCKYKKNFVLKIHPCPFNLMLGKEYKMA